MKQENPDSELMQQGYRSYHKAVFAVMEFRREAEVTIHTVLEDRAPELAAAMKLDKDELLEGISPFTMPDKLTREYDGSEAKVGIRVPKNSASPWLMYFFVWIGDGEPPQLFADIELKNPGSLIAKLKVSCKDKELRAEEREAWISEIIPTDGSRDLSTVCNSLLDRWIEVWTKVGGLRQFLPEKV